MAKKFDVVVIGSCVIDLNFYTKSLPLAGETVVGTFDTGLGGKGFNQAVASARSGARTLFIGAVGEDVFGEQFKAFKERNLTTRLVTIEGQKTGTASISVSESGQNSIVVALGANLHLTIDHVTEHSKLIKGAKVGLLQQENSKELLVDVIYYLRAFNQNMKLILNPAPNSDKIEDLRSDKIKNYLPEVDLITPNETEFDTLFGVSPTPISNLIEKVKNLALKCGGYKVLDGVPLDLLRYRKPLADRFFLNIGASVGYIVTLGERGSMFISQFITLYIPPIKVDKVVDTSGAGDTFNGALAAKLALTEFDIEPSIKFATSMAAVSVTRVGTSKSIPKVIKGVICPI